ncbi:ion transport protein [Cryptosporidium ryanae]|uniref:ion transport protein n=1 Tax=Cryptosporidium ryanae TaxID=515981 RepID=UPI00351A083D|nr:ion transport protein [Cryptosporidium ryanae]
MIFYRSWLSIPILIIYGASLIVCHFFLFYNPKYLITLALAIGIFLCTVLLVILIKILIYPLETFRGIKRYIFGVRRKLIKRRLAKLSLQKDIEVKKIQLEEFLGNLEGCEKLEKKENNALLFNNFNIEFTLDSERRYGSNNDENNHGQSNMTSKILLNYADPSTNVLANVNSFVSSNSNNNKISDKIASITSMRNNSLSTRRSITLNLKELEQVKMSKVFNLKYISNIPEENIVNSRKLDLLRSKILHIYDRYFLRGLNAFFSKDFVRVSVFLINLAWAFLWIVDTCYLTRGSYEEPWKIMSGIETLLLFDESFLWIADLTLFYKVLLEISRLSRGINRIMAIKHLITSSMFVSLFEVLTTSPFLLIMKYLIGTGPITTLFVFGFLRFFRLLNPIQMIFTVFYWSTEVMRTCITIIWTIICVVLGFSGAMMIIESPRQNFKNLFDFVYYTIITISTVGYGDYSPTYFVSRLICIVLIIFTIIYVPNQISKLFQLAQIPPETIGACNIGVYNETVFEKEHIHTKLVLVIGAPSVKHLSYLLMELNQLNSNIDLIKKFNGTSGNIIRYQPIVMVLTTVDPREYSELVKDSQISLNTQLFVKKIKNFENLKEDIESIRGFITAIYFWSDAINAQVLYSTDISPNDNFNEKNVNYNDMEIKKSSKVVTYENLLDLERNTMMDWYSVRKFLSLDYYEYLFRTRQNESVFMSEKLLFRKYGKSNSDKFQMDISTNYSIDSVVVFNGEDSDFKLDNALRDDHFYDLYGIQDVNTSRRTVLFNNPILKAPSKPEEISSYLFYLSKMSNTNHHNEMDRMRNIIRDRINFERKIQKNNKNGDFQNNINQAKFKNSYKSVYIAEVRSRLLAKTSLCPGFSTLLTNLFNTIKIEDSITEKSVYYSIKGILDEYGHNKLYQQVNNNFYGNIYKNSNNSGNNVSDVNETETIDIDMSDLENGILNGFSEVNTTKDNDLLTDVVSKASLFTKDYIKGTFCELLEIPLPEYMNNMQFLQITSFLYDLYSIICIGITVDVKEEPNSELQINQDGYENNDYDEDNVENDLFNFIITSDDESCGRSETPRNYSSSGGKSSELEDTRNETNKNGTSEILSFKKLRIFANKLKVNKPNTNGGDTSICLKNTEKLQVGTTRRKILNPSDYIIGNKWKYGDFIIGKDSDVKLLIISNSKEKIFSFIHEREKIKDKLKNYQQINNLQVKQSLNYIKLCLQGKTQLINNKLIIPSWKVDTPITPRIRKSTSFRNIQVRGLPPSPVHRELKYSKISHIEKLEMFCPSKIEGYIHGTTFILLVCEWPESIQEFLNGIILNRSIPVGWDYYRYNRYFKTTVPISSQSLILSTIIVFLSKNDDDKYFNKAIVPPGCIGIHINGNSSNDEDLIRSGLFYAHSIVVCSSNSINSDSKVVTTCWRIHSLINMKIQAEIVLLRKKGVNNNNQSSYISKLQNKNKNNIKNNESELKNRELKLFDAKWNMWQWKITANLAQLTKKWLFEGGHLPPCFFPAIIADIRFEDSLPLLDNTSWISSSKWDFSTCPTVISGRVLTTDMIIPVIFRSIRINPILATSDSIKPLLGYNERYNFFNSPMTFDNQIRNNISNFNLQRFYSASSNSSPEDDFVPDYTEWGALELITIPERFYGCNFSTLFREMLRISGIITIAVVHTLTDNCEIPNPHFQEFSSYNGFQIINENNSINYVKNHLNQISPKFNLNNRILLLSPNPKYIISKSDLIYIVTPVTKIF